MVLLQYRKNRALLSRDNIFLIMRDCRYGSKSLSPKNEHDWLVVYPPLWKIWVRQLGWWLFPIYGKIKFMFQTTNQMKIAAMFIRWSPENAPVLTPHVPKMMNESTVCRSSVVIHPCNHHLMIKSWISRDISSLMDMYDTSMYYIYIALKYPDFRLLNSWYI